MPCVYTDIYLTDAIGTIASLGLAPLEARNNTSIFAKGTSADASFSRSFAVCELWADFCRDPVGSEIVLQSRPFGGTNSMGGLMGDGAMVGCAEFPVLTARVARYAPRAAQPRGAHCPSASPRSHRTAQAHPGRHSVAPAGNSRPPVDVITLIN